MFGYDYIVIFSALICRGSMTLGKSISFQFCKKKREGGKLENFHPYWQSEMLKLIKFQMNEEFNSHAPLTLEGRRMKRRISSNTFARFHKSPSHLTFIHINFHLVRNSLNVPLSSIKFNHFALLSTLSPISRRFQTAKLSTWMKYHQ